MNLVPGYNENSFSDDVISRWGPLSEELTDDANLLHPQMAALGRLCLSNSENCSDILRFLEDVLNRNDAIAEIENAIAISFVQWPELKTMADSTEVAPRVAQVVQTQWEQFGGNF